MTEFWFEDLWKVMIVKNDSFSQPDVARISAVAAKAKMSNCRLCVFMRSLCQAN